jgi:hypothetical protein
MTQQTAGKFTQKDVVPKGYTKKRSRWRWPHNVRRSEVSKALLLACGEPVGFAQGARVRGGQDTFRNDEPGREKLRKERLRAHALLERLLGRGSVEE